MTTDLHHIPFHGAEVLAVKINDKPHVVLKPAFEAIGIDADRQIRNIQKRSWSRTAVTAVQVGDQVRKMVVADVRTFLMALATIPSTRVNVAARPLLEAFQDEVADVIEAYFDKGAAINRRVTEEQLPAVMGQAMADYRTAREKQIAEDAAERTAQVNLLGLAASLGLVDPTWSKTKALVIVSRGIGEVPEIPQEELPLYVEEFMRSKGVSRLKIGRFSGAFGKKILNLVANEGGPIPGKRAQELPDGSIREVTAWTKEHLPIFERAWEASYARDPRVMA